MSMKNRHSSPGSKSKNTELGCWLPNLSSRRKFAPLDDFSDAVLAVQQSSHSTFLTADPKQAQKSFESALEVAASAMWIAARLRNLFAAFQTVSMWL